MKRLSLPIVNQRGLTLIELMIGMALGLIVLAGIGYIYLGSRQTYKLQDNMARIQENGRYAMDILGREIRMAGFQECSTAKFTSTINAQAGALNNYLYDFSRNPVEGFNATGTGTWSTVTSGNPAPTVGVSNVASDVVSQTDVIALRSSGFRSPELCNAIGSSSTSQHTRGEAADFEIFSIANKALAEFIVSNLDFDQCILEFWNENESYSGWVHCSYSSKYNRRQYLKADKVNGKIVYLPVY